MTVLAAGSQAGGAQHDGESDLGTGGTQHRWSSEMVMQSCGDAGIGGWARKATRSSSRAAS